MINTLICKTCSTPLKGLQKKYCSRQCHNASGNAKHQNYHLQQLRAISRKTSLILSKGGKCEICGYNRNIAALQFHHLDPSLKEHGLDSRKLSNMSMESILKEVEKCQLLCSNCHAEVHHTDAKFILGNSL